MSKPTRWVLVFASLAAACGCWLIFRFEDGEAFELDLVDHR